ncbi:hypothetical protein DdX_01466 [Ditylenchus destructor]|uniref:Uncharacterized protein n=1 Tax=Ditylenchus destructor TaxID=166010 RepID=A0AAD4NFN9_9BILA|nr:hypothetical protein DdX_01466 [Ditylenchus destructor]
MRPTLSLSSPTIPKSRRRERNLERNIKPISQPFVTQPEIDWLKNTHKEETDATFFGPVTDTTRNRGSAVDGETREMRDISQQTK